MHRVSFSGNSKHDKVISDEVTVFGSLPRLFCYVLHKRFICNSLAGYSWHGQRYDRPVQRQIQPSSLLWEVKGGRTKGKSLEADRINRHLDNIRIRTVVMAISGLNRVSVLFLFLELVQSACPTSRRSAVQIRLFPPKTSHSLRVACFVGVRETAR